MPPSAASYGGCERWCVMAFLASVIVLAIGVVLYQRRELVCTRRRLQAARSARESHWKVCVERSAEKDALRAQLVAATRRLETLRLQFCESLANQAAAIKERDDARKEVAFLERDLAVSQAYSEQLMDLQTCPECHEVDRSAGWFEPAAPTVVSLKIVN